MALSKAGFFNAAGPYYRLNKEAEAAKENFSHPTEQRALERAVEKLIVEKQFPELVSFARSQTTHSKKSHCVKRIIQTIPSVESASLLELIETIEVRQLRCMPLITLAERLFSQGKVENSLEIVARLKQFPLIVEEFCEEKALYLFSLDKSRQAFACALMIEHNPLRRHLLCTFLECLLLAGQRELSRELLDTASEDDQNYLRKTMAKVLLLKGEQSNTLEMINKITEFSLQLSCFREFPLLVDKSQYLIDTMLEMYNSDILYQCVRYFAWLEPGYGFTRMRYLADNIQDTPLHKTTILQEEVQSLIKENEPYAAHRLAGAIPSVRIKSKMRFENIKKNTTHDPLLVSHLEQAASFARDIPVLEFASAARFEIVKGYIRLGELDRAKSAACDDDSFYELARVYANFSDYDTARTMADSIQDKAKKRLAHSYIAKVEKNASVDAVGKSLAKLKIDEKPSQ